MNQKLRDKILAIADALPTGRFDLRCMAKLSKERRELDEALQDGDTLGAILEAGDVAYYAIKSWWNGDLFQDVAEKIIHQVAKKVGLTVDQVMQVAITKMTLRARPGNPKNDAEERQAVSVFLKGEAK